MTHRFQHDRLVLAGKLGEACAGHDLALPYIRDTDDLDNVAMAAGAGSLDVVAQLLVEELDHRGSKVGRVQLGAVLEVLEEEHGVGPNPLSRTLLAC